MLRIKKKKKEIFKNSTLYNQFHVKMIDNKVRRYDILPKQQSRPFVIQIHPNGVIY
jgi:hypothetical protein